MSPSKPVRPQVVNELVMQNGSHAARISTVMDRDDIAPIVRRALEEDLPDITSEAIFTPRDRGTAAFVIKASGILAGLDFAEETFAELDDSSEFIRHVDDGATVRPGDVVAEVSATVIALLSGERTALNFMQRASGIAATTRRYVDAIAGTKAKIYDTRKTAPGLRILDKYAVKCGGGENHRIGLHDMFLVKNNHIDRAGSIAGAIERIRSRGLGQKIMVEVRDMRELDEALAETPDFILLDNMTPDQIRDAVARTAGRAILEASGGITLENVRQYAEAGVERISIGALTHSVKALDISMRVQT